MDKISEALGAMTAVEQPERQTALTTTNEVDEKTQGLKKRAADNLRADYEEARTNLKELITDSMGLMPNLVSLVREAESPRMYESASAFIKMLAELNKDLLAVSADIDKGSKGTERPAVQTNGEKKEEGNTTVFIGTSDELFKSLSRRRTAEQTIDGQFIAVDTTKSE